MSYLRNTGKDKRKKKKKDERLSFLLGLDSAAFVTHDTVIMVFLD